MINFNCKLWGSDGDDNISWICLCDGVSFFSDYEVCDSFGDGFGFYKSSKGDGWCVEVRWYIRSWRVRSFCGSEYFFGVGNVFRV